MNVEWIPEKKNFQNVTRKRNHQVQKEKSLSTQLLVVVHFYYSKITFSSSWKVTNMKKKNKPEIQKQNLTATQTCIAKEYSRFIFYSFIITRNYQNKKFVIHAQFYRVIMMMMSLHFSIMMMKVFHNYNS